MFAGERLKPPGCGNGRSRSETRAVTQLPAGLLAVLRGRELNTMWAVRPRSAGKHETVSLVGVLNGPWSCTVAGSWCRKLDTLSTRFPSQLIYLVFINDPKKGDVCVCGVSRCKGFKMIRLQCFSYTNHVVVQNIHIYIGRKRGGHDRTDGGHFSKKHTQTLQFLLVNRHTDNVQQRKRCVQRDDGGETRRVIWQCASGWGHKFSRRFLEAAFCVIYMFKKGAEEI